MTFLVKKLHSRSLPYGRNKLQLSVKSQKCKKKRSCFTVLPPSSRPGTREGKRGEKERRNSINRKEGRERETIYILGDFILILRPLSCLFPSDL